MVAKGVVFDWPKGVACDQNIAHTGVDDVRQVPAHQSINETVAITSAQTNTTKTVVLSSYGQSRMITKLRTVEIQKTELHMYGYTPEYGRMYGVTRTALTMLSPSSLRTARSTLQDCRKTERQCHSP